MARSPSLAAALLLLALAAHAQTPAESPTPVAEDAGVPAGPVADAGSYSVHAGPSALDAGPPPWTYPYAFPTEKAAAVRRDNVETETRVLVDAAGAGATQASLALVTATAAIEIWPHRHPAGAEVAYLLEGAARVRGLGHAWVDLAPGDAVYLPAGVAHGWWWAGSKKRPMKLLFLYAPPGPERALTSTAANDVAVPVPAAELKKPGPHSPLPLVMAASAASTFPIAGGKATVRILFDAASAHDGSAYVGLLRAQPGTSVAAHAHENEAEVLYVVSGRGTMTLDGVPAAVEPGLALHLPPGHRHTLDVQQALEAVQFYAPSGPEQRFKGPKK